MSCVEAAKRGRNVRIADKHAAFGLRQTLQNGGQMCGIDRFGRVMKVHESKHRASDFILVFGREIMNGFDGLFEQLRHSDCLWSKNQMALFLPTFSGLPLRAPSALLSKSDMSHRSFG